MGLAGFWEGIKSFAANVKDMSNIGFTAWIGKKITQANGLVDVVTGQAKSGMSFLADGLLGAIGESLTGNAVPQVPCILDDKDIFLNKDLADKLRENLEEDTFQKLGKIPQISFFTIYRDKSEKLVKLICEGLKKYEEQFEVFTVDKRFKIFPKRVNYMDIWNCRKQMKDILKSMCKMIDNYGPDDYTHGALLKFKSKEAWGTEYESDYKKEQENLAIKIFESAYADLGTIVNGRVWQRSATESIPWGDLGETFESHTDYIAEFKTHLETIFKDSESVERIIQNFWFIMGCKIAGPMPSPSVIKATKGYKDVCLLVAGNFLNELARVGTSKLQIDGNLQMGDYANRMKKCFEHTLEKLDEVINLGAKEADIRKGDQVGVETDKGIMIGVNLEELLGQKTYNGIQKDWKMRQKTLNDAIGDADYLARKMLKACSDAKKEYEKIKKLAEKIKVEASFGEEDLKGRFKKLKDLKVTVDSRSEDSGEKEYDIKDRFDTQIKPLEKSSNKSKDVMALTLRKVTKFLEACKTWNDEFKDCNKKEKNIIYAKVRIAKNNLKEARKLYNQLLKTKGITSDQKKAIRKAYSGLPSFLYTYARRLKENDEKMYEFLGLHFDEKTNELLGKDGKVIT